MGTDKLYITHSEWNSGDQFSASAGSSVRENSERPGSFRRLPFKFCALSLQPFTTPVCTADGQMFDHENIIRWLMDHNTNPTDGKPLRQSDLIAVKLAKNDAGDYIDPVTYKVLTDNTHVVAIRHGDSANAFAYDTIDRLNIKTKTWRDLVSDEEFMRKDIITLQDPQNLESKNLSSFKYLNDGVDSGTPKEHASINQAALGKKEKIERAKEAVASARERSKAQAENASARAVAKSRNSGLAQPESMQGPKQTPVNASHHTSGMAAASFTSTGVTPHTSGALQLLSDEEFLLRRGRVRQKGYVRLSLSSSSGELGNMTLELETEYAPKAVWNFVHLVQRKYYDGIRFHRNIRNFMIQGGDPSGTGKGGASIWGKNFEDELEGPLKHDARGTLSMANKGKDTNSSQFFILYRAAKHLDRKHTIFGHVADGVNVLDTLEKLPTDQQSRPLDDIVIDEATVLVNPFEEYQKKQKETEDAENEREQRRREGANDEDRTTWTGKRLRQDGTISREGTAGVGKYLKKARMQSPEEGGGQEDELGRQRAKKKSKPGIGGGFGNFDGW